MTLQDKAQRLEALANLRAEIYALRAGQIAVAPSIPQACEVLAQWMDEANRITNMSEIIKTM